MSVCDSKVSNKRTTLMATRGENTATLYNQEQPRGGSIVISLAGRAMQLRDIEALLCCDVSPANRRFPGRVPRG